MTVSAVIRGAPSRGAFDIVGCERGEAAMCAGYEANEGISKEGSRLAPGGACFTWADGDAVRDLGLENAASGGDVGEDCIREAGCFNEFDSASLSDEH